MQAQEKRRHEGRVVLVTGVARGQGREIALEFARSGAKVAGVDICGPIKFGQYAPSTADDLDETAKLLSEFTDDVLLEEIDVRDLERMQGFVARVVEQFGGIDVLCVNHGFVQWTPFLDLTVDEWENTFSINATGSFCAAKSVAPTMIEQGSGVIILTASCTAVEPAKDATHYSCSKHAVLGLGRNLALELGGYGIRVNTVMPSAVNTLMTNNEFNLKKMDRDRNGGVESGGAGMTEEDFFRATRNWHVLRNRPALPATSVAQAVSWLASDSAKYLTGVELPVDGGHLVLPGFNHNAVVDGEVIVLE
jgi:NAD(P)-dependent dehydrogenase (short-subunit alcohol dehydrogenase family)